LTNWAMSKTSSEFVAMYVSNQSALANGNN
jgi:hypothetical protein